MVKEALDDLTEQLSDVTVMAEEIGKRLAPAMRQEPAMPSNGGVDPNKSFSCPIAEDIRQQAARAHMVASDLKTILSLLEI